MKYAVEGGFSDTMKRECFLALGFLGSMYFVCSLFGYGSDVDTYLLLKTWKTLMETGAYVPSRGAGFLIPEMVVGAAASIGGSLLSNTISLIFGLGALSFFYLLLRKHVGHGTALVAAVCIGVNPYIIIAASSSHDYTYGLFFFLAGILALTKDAPRITAVLFACAVGTRLSYGVTGLIAFSAYFMMSHNIKGRFDVGVIAQTLAVYLGLCLFFYLPGILWAGDIAVLGRIHELYDVTLFGNAARWAYKNIHIWGLPGVMVLAVLAAIQLKRRVRPRFGNIVLPAALAMVVLFYLAAFFRLPHEISYLIPILFICVYLMTCFYSSKVPYYLLAAAFLFNAFVRVDFLRIDYRTDVPGRVAKGANVELHVKRGVLLEDLQARADEEELMKTHAVISREKYEKP